MGGLSQVRLELNREAGMPLLQVENLEVAFRRQEGFLGRQSLGITAVHNVSFNIFEGEFVALVGESGSGKSTIARCIALLTPPTGGSIKYNGLEITRLKGRALSEYRRNVQIIYQDPFESLNPRQDVFDAIASPIRNLRGEKRHSALEAAVLDLLAEVGLDPWRVLYKLPHQLSGGERQRVNIARALASQPKLLIADEPITMLDAAQRFNILSLLLELKSKRNLSVLMITHDLASAKLVSERVLVIYLGRIVEQGYTSEVILKPHHPYVEMIMDSMPRDGWLSAASGEQGLSIEDSLNVQSGCVFAPRCKYVTQICYEREPLLDEKSLRHEAACYNPINISRNPTKQ
jgi:peptide/nickel transport system ATP-binding protein